MTASYRHMRPKSRRPCSMATGSRPLAWGRMTERLLRARCRPRARQQARPGVRDRCRGIVVSSAIKKIGAKAASQTQRQKAPPA
jgi:hypothetical protein